MLQILLSIKTFLVFCLPMSILSFGQECVTALGPLSLPQSSLKYIIVYNKYHIKLIEPLNVLATKSGHRYHYKMREPPLLAVETAYPCGLL